MVEQFHAQGSLVAFVDVNPEAAQNVLERLKGSQSKLPRFVQCDLRDIAQLRRVIAELEESCGSFDVLVNNAARDDRHSFESLEPEAWDEYLAINLRHQIFATQAVSAGMRKKGGGSVVMFGSATWMRGKPGFVGYTSAKAAINGATRTLARELGDSGIRVNCIVPGLVVTERAKELWFSPKQIEDFVASQALKFALLPPEVSRMALFLAADDSRGCTGQNFIVDAGVTLN